MARKAITERMKIDALLDMALGYSGVYFCIFCHECHKGIFPGQRIDWDHRQALIHAGQHDYQNIRPVHYDCHKAKTKRDVQANAKVKRIASGGRKRKGRKLQGKGFSKKPDGYQHRWGKRPMTPSVREG